MRDNITKRIGILYFSPTNSTKRICTAIALGMGAGVPVDLNITNLDFRTKISSNPNALLENMDQLIIGAPVYTGKLPLQVIECLKALNGTGKECTTVVVYGNRDYGVALYQMVEILTNNGFNIKAAGAFIGQHSYSDIMPVAIGRPDNADLEKAYNFGKNSLNRSKYLSLKDILVQKDMFSKSKNYTPIIPIFKSEKCALCGACSKRCPINIISSETGDFMNQEAKNKCLGCMACVSICKKKARFIKPNIIMKLVIKFLLKNPSINRKEPLTIFSSEG